MLRASCARHSEEAPARHARRRIYLHTTARQSDDVAADGGDHALPFRLSSPHAFSPAVDSR